jgi:hypothetical protein
VISALHMHQAAVQPRRPAVPDLEPLRHEAVSAPVCRPWDLPATRQQSFGRLDEYPLVGEFLAGRGDDTRSWSLVRSFRRQDRAARLR